LSDSSDKLTVILDKDAVQELADKLTLNNEIQINIDHRRATDEEKTSKARQDRFLIGYDVYIVNIKIGDYQVTTLKNPMRFLFDVTKLTNQEELSIAGFDLVREQWVNSYSTLSDNILKSNIYSLGNFAITKGQIGEVKGIKITKKETKDTSIDNSIEKINLEAQDVFDSGLGVSSDQEKQINPEKLKVVETYTNSLVENLELEASSIYSITNFINDGTPSTLRLGAGERAGVLDSYKSAFGKLPTEVSEWEDCIKIANGRWPSARSAKAEARAKEEFQNYIYKREADMSAPHDNAAVTIMAYGLRPANRNLDSEKAAIKIFRAIYSASPQNALDWDIVRAIAYSGATR